MTCSRLWPPLAADYVEASSFHTTQTTTCLAKPKPAQAHCLALQWNDCTTWWSLIISKPPWHISTRQACILSLPAQRNIMYKSHDGTSTQPTAGNAHKGDTRRQSQGDSGHIHIIWTWTYQDVHRGRQALLASCTHHSEAWSKASWCSSAIFNRHNRQPQQHNRNGDQNTRALHAQLAGSSM